MEEYEGRDVSPQEDQPHADDSPPEPSPLCLNCLQPVDALAYYCPHCGSSDAVNPLATYIPLVDLRFMYGTVGKLWREIVYGRMHAWKRALLALFIVVMLPAAIPFLLVPTLFCGGIDERPLLWRTFWLVFATAVGAVAVYLTAASFFSLVPLWLPSH